MQKHHSLLERVRAGDDSALDELLSRRAERIYGRMYRATRDKQLAKTVTVNTLRQSYQAIIALGSVEHFDAWMDAIADRELCAARDAAVTPGNSAHAPSIDPQSIAIDSDDDVEYASPEPDLDVTDGDEEYDDGARGSVWLKLVLCLLIIVGLWMLAGFLMVARRLPIVDLGYTWFNTNIFYLFK